MVYQGTRPINMEIIVSKLYKYAKVYLREVMFNLYNDKRKNIVDILSTFDSKI